MPPSIHLDVLRKLSRTADKNFAKSFWD